MPATITTARVYFARCGYFALVGRTIGLLNSPIADSYVRRCLLVAFWPGLRPLRNQVGSREAHLLIQPGFVLNNCDMHVALSVARFVLCRVLGHLVYRFVGLVIFCDA